MLLQGVLVLSLGFLMSLGLAWFEDVRFVDLVVPFFIKADRDYRTFSS